MFDRFRGRQDKVSLDCCDNLILPVNVMSVELVQEGWGQVRRPWNVNAEGQDLSSRLVKMNRPMTLGIVSSDQIDSRFHKTLTDNVMFP